ncbi:MAG: hypothetical protein ACO3GH_06705, partial [Ilumatobacteraceae bacterium]
MGFPRTRSAVVASLVIAVAAAASLGSSSPVFADTGCQAAVAPTQVSGVYEIDSAEKLRWA